MKFQPSKYERDERLYDEPMHAVSIKQIVEAAEERCGGRGYYGEPHYNTRDWLKPLLEKPSDYWRW